MPAAITVAHDIRSPLWRGQKLRATVLSDLHVISPWTSLAALSRIVEQVNASSPDIILLPGDFLADPKLIGRRAKAHEIIPVLERLKAPLGVHASLGNHDWKDCDLARQTNGARNSVAEAFAGSSITLHTNSSSDLGPFWIAGVDSTQGFGSSRHPKPRHDLTQALSGIPEGADTILLAHEPDLWIEERPDVALTVSGHTHGGQITFGNWRPLTPSRYGGRYAHGLHSDGDRHLVVSGGLGFTGVPIRIGAPPEITLIEISREES